MDEKFDIQKRKRAYLRAVGPDEGAAASIDPENWTGASIRHFTSTFDDPPKPSDTGDLNSQSLDSSRSEIDQLK